MREFEVQSFKYFDQRFGEKKKNQKNVYLWQHKAIDAALPNLHLSEFLFLLFSRSVKFERIDSNNRIYEKFLCLRHVRGNLNLKNLNLNPWKKKQKSNKFESYSRNVDEFSHFIYSCPRIGFESTFFFFFFIPYHSSSFSGISKVHSFIFFFFKFQSIFFLRPTIFYTFVLSLKNFHFLRKISGFSFDALKPTFCKTKLGLGLPDEASAMKSPEQKFHLNSAFSRCWESTPVEHNSSDEIFSAQELNFHYRTK